ncbi:nucleolar protein, putative [Ichthyophthirius multifiliis]|uniref:Nucleolar protein, putative n=1 Tax=Ichthyophthirius multifiliis TaxID=5932 RepID=G0QMP9_ICHMU|nr:nucleolar protein, putative [Ichthyophthirius multifiliis]EGR33505.1 nucleolar protein, putative [Ichthyophthirius multifiliis]|eukprot:XP_004037491.1 nucleolar protein, putative [Ichthyophthirius multifiliis]
MIIVKYGKEYFSVQKIQQNKKITLKKKAMWASDKEPNQQQLAEELSKLILSVNQQKLESILLWIQATFSIMNKEWSKIDYWRVNKFQSLIRKIFIQIVRFLQKKKYNQDVINL